MKPETTPRSFGTHDGTFHADEVTACALLLIFNLIDQDKIIRTRDLALLETCQYICDVGGVYDPSIKRFDHHQSEYTGPMSSAGMILLYLKEQKLITEREYDFFRDMIILGVDDHDNGRDPLIKGICTYSHIIASFVLYEDKVTVEMQNAAFFRALEFAKGLLQRMLDRYRYMQDCKELVRATMDKYKQCLMFDKYVPWLEVFFELGGESHPALFMIMPSGDYWKLRGIPPNLEKKMQVRHPLPEEWSGLLEDELEKVSGIPGAVFCHKGRFISVWKTKEDALKALEYTLKGVS